MSDKTSYPILLNEHGLPARKLELPEELIEELNQGWTTFVERQILTGMGWYPKEIFTKVPTTFWEWFWFKVEKDSKRGQIDDFWLALIYTIWMIFWILLTSRKEYIGFQVYVQVRREEILNDPAQLLLFLEQTKQTLWKKHEDTWSKRLQKITDDLATGKVHLANVKETETDPDLLVIAEARVQLVIQRLEEEREEIIRLQDEVAGGTKALEHVAKLLSGEFTRLKMTEERTKWLTQMGTDQPESKLVLERSRVELRAAVAWFQDLLRTQAATVQVALDERPLLPNTTSPPPTPWAEREVANLEIADELLDRLTDDLKKPRPNPTKT